MFLGLKFELGEWFFVVLFFIYGPLALFLVIFLWMQLNQKVYAEVLRRHEERDRDGQL